MPSYQIIEHMLNELIAQNEDGVIAPDFHELTVTKKGKEKSTVESYRHDWANAEGQFLQTYVTIFNEANEPACMDFGYRLSPNKDFLTRHRAIEEICHSDEYAEEHTDHPLRELTLAFITKFEPL